MMPLERHIDERIAIVGRSGYGKTNAAKVAVEFLLEQGARVCVMDPTDAWFGLRLSINGKKPAFPVVIFGGVHADLPLNEHSGETVGRAIATSSQSCIVSLAEFVGENARRRFASAFLAALYAHNREPLHLVVDEADTLAPQKPMAPLDNEVLARMQQVVRRGRIRGFVPWLLTQRPAVLNKDVLSQADVLVAFNLTSSQDRDAIGGWIEGQADRAQEKAILATLPRLPRGTAVVWAPGVARLEPVPFPLSKTFDSGRTPKRGEERQDAKLQPIDVGALREKLTTVESEAKANDPKHLRAEIARLQAELRKAQAGGGANAAEVEAARAEGCSRGAQQAERALQGFLTAQIRRLNNLRDALQEEASVKIGVAIQELEPYRRDPGAAPVAPAKPSLPAPGGRVPASAQKPSTFTQPYPVGAKGGAELRVLKVLAQRHPARFTRAQWATLAGMSKGGGTFQTYLSRLRAAGYLDESDGTVGVTAEGMAACGTVPPAPSTPDEVIAQWKASLGGGPGRIIDALVEIYPEGIERTALAERLDMAAGGGTFATYLSRLRSNGLVEVRGRQIRASGVLFGGQH